MSVVAAVKKAIAYGADHHWREELPEPERSAHYGNLSLYEHAEWKDAYIMECAEKYVEARRYFQARTVFDI